MAGAAGLQAVAPQAAVHRRQRVGPRVAPRGGAGLVGALRRGLYVRVVARAALGTVRLVLRLERAQPLLHVVAAEALFVRGHEGRARRIDGVPLGSRHGEFVAHDAVQVRLLRHFAQLNALGIVTSGLRAGFAHRLEAMHFLRMAGGALDLRHRRR
ncbi:MAG TPA: hypothetical protein VIK50_12975, partial [Gemmatimonadaceae bacterium]